MPTQLSLPLSTVAPVRNPRRPRIGGVTRAATDRARAKSLLPDPFTCTGGRADESPKSTSLPTKKVSTHRITNRRIGAT